MTGIERLRSVARAKNFLEPDEARLLDGIADQIEREHAEDCFKMGERAADVSMSAYDLLPQEDRDAIAWVRDHGGLERVNLERDQLYGVLRETCDLLDVSYFGVWTTDAQSIWRKFDWYKARLSESIPRAAYERHIARRQRQIDESHAALRRRNERIAELERERNELYEMVRQLNARTDEMEKHLMPDGMEWLVEAWPRFEDDAPLRFLDDFERYGEENGVSAVTMYSDGSFALNFRAYSKGEHVKRPAPKVRDADGVEICVGDEVFCTNGHGPFEVTRIVYADQLRVICDDEKNGHLNVFPESITHRAPVLAADGKPLREGETVWSKGGCQYVVEDASDPNAVKCRSASVPTSGMTAPASCFTHERPDSWERLEEDAEKFACEYFGRGGKKDTCTGCRSREIDPCTAKDCEFNKTIDLVRRAKALAERDA